MSGEGLGDRAGRWPMLLALIVMWIALWGNVSVANIVGGALVAIAVLMFADGLQPAPVRHLSVAAALRYLQTFAVQLIIANWQVARAVLQPSRIEPGILAVPLRHASDAVVTLVANSITLTPGTLTLETERRGDVAILYVHALELADPDSVREDVSELEKRAVDAFAGPKAQAVAARTLAELEDRTAPEKGMPEGQAAPTQGAGQSGTDRSGERPQETDGVGDGEERT